LYDELAFHPLPLVLVAFTLVPSPCPIESPPPPSLIYTYTINDSCFHPLVFLSPYFPEIASVLEYGVGLPQEGETFEFFHLILITLVSRQVAENLVEICS